MLAGDDQAADQFLQASPGALRRDGEAGLREPGHFDEQREGTVEGFRVVRRHGLHGLEQLLQLALLLSGDDALHTDFFLHLGNRDLLSLSRVSGTQGTRGW